MNRPKSLAQRSEAPINEYEKTCLDPVAVDELIVCIESLKQAIEQNKEQLKA